MTSKLGIARCLFELSISFADIKLNHWREGMGGGGAVLMVEYS